MKSMKLLPLLLCFTFIPFLHPQLFSAPKKAIAIAGAPIVRNTDGDTVGMEITRYSAWLKQITVVSFQKNHEGQKWEKDGAVFIESMIPFLAEQLLQNSNLDTISGERLEQGRRLQAQGCDDPLISFLITFGEYRLYKKGQGTFKTMCMAVKTMDNENHHSKTLVSVLSTLCIQFSRTEAEHNDINPLLLEALAKATSEPYYHQDGGEFFFIRDISRSMSGDYAKNIVEPLKEIIGSAKGFPQWVYNTSLGMIFISDAWKARGDLLAYAVTDDQWKTFYERLDIAEKYLMLAWEENPNNHFVPTNMITIIMGKSARNEKEELRKWFDRAVSIQIDNYRPYQSYSYALLPRWGGSIEEVITLSNSVRNAAIKNQDTLLWARYVDMIHSLRNEYDLDAISFFRLPQFAKSMMVMRQIEYKQRERSNNSISRLAYNAYMTGFYDIAYKYFDKLNWDAETPELKAALAFRNFEPVAVFGETMVHHLAKDEMERASELLDEKNVAEALLYYDKANEKANHFYANEYILMCKSIAEDKVKFDSYEWASIVPVKSKYSWRWIANDSEDDSWWEFLDDGRLKVYTSYNVLRGLLAYRLALPPRYEIVTTFEFFDDEPEQRFGDAFSVLLGYQYDRNKDWINAAVIPDINRDGVISNESYLLKEYYQMKNAMVPFPLDIKVSEVTVKVWNGRIWLYVNGHSLFKNYSVSGQNYLNWPLTNIGFGIPKNGDGKGFIVKEMKIRKLRNAP